MRVISFTAQRSTIRRAALNTFAAIVLPVSLCAQSLQVAPRPNLRLPDESAGIDAIVSTLIRAFDQVDIIALGEAHFRKVDSDLRMALVRHPDFAKTVRSIVIECGSTTEQSTLDRYIRGENVSKAQLERVWKTTTYRTNGFCDDPMYADFLTAVRDVNSKLPVDARIRVLGGDSGPEGREVAAAAILREPVLQRRGKALVIYGAAHFYLTGPAEYLASLGDNTGTAGSLDIDYPRRWLSVIPIGGVARPSALKETDVDPDYRKFDRALRSQVRPVLISLQRLPFRDFTAAEFLGRTVITCRPPGGCRSVFKGSTLTLGRMADAGVYVGRDPDAARN
jgi:hypothetical protein